MKSHMTLTYTMDHKNKS